MYDFYEAQGTPDPRIMISAGTCADDYVIERYGTFTFVLELPYFTHPDVADIRPADLTRREVIERAAVRKRGEVQLVQELYTPIRPFLSIDSPFRRVVDMYERTMGEDIDAEVSLAQNPEFDVPATRAQVCDALGLRRYRFLGLLGQMLRAVQVELTAGHSVPALMGIVRPINKERQRLAEELAVQAPVVAIPRTTLVSVMADACLDACDAAS